MHLVDILSLRPVPAAGLFLALTRRCPLSCAHCSTRSSLTAEEHDGALFTRFLDSLRKDDRPELVLLTGGEPLLRPQLVADLADRAHAVGARVALISGMFFARQGATPPAIERALARVDHLTASLDRFHEREVPRGAVLRALRAQIDAGRQVSLQVVGLGPDDSYLAEVTAEARRALGDRAPLLVSAVGAVGRAADWLPPERADATDDAGPCAMAAWPVVSFDGTVVACCNQGVVDGPAPPHLRLGHAATDGWPAIRARLLDRPLLRAIRTLGPCELAARRGARGPCAACATLSDAEAPAVAAAAFAARPGARALERSVAALQGARDYGLPAYAGLITLGRRSP